jgi:hypothetical protein
MDFSRRGFIGFLTGLTGSVLAGGKVPLETTAATLPKAPTPALALPSSPLAAPGATLREALRTRLGEDIFMSWFHTLEFESFDGKTVTVSVPVKFLRTWIKSHWSDELLDSCGVEFARAQQVDVVLRHRAAVFGTDCTGRSLIFP